MCAPGRMPNASSDSDHSCQRSPARKSTRDQMNLVFGPCDRPLDPFGCRMQLLVAPSVEWRTWCIGIRYRCSGSWDRVGESESVKPLMVVQTKYCVGTPCWKC